MYVTVLSCSIAILNSCAVYSVWFYCLIFLGGGVSIKLAKRQLVGKITGLEQMISVR